MTTVKLCDICHIEKWKTGIKQAIPGDFPMVTTAEKRISHESYQIDAKAVIIPLVSSTGHGHASINRLHYQEGKFALGSILCAVIPKDGSVLSARWLYQFLSFNKDEILVPLMKGAANVSLSTKRIGDIEIQLPSIEQQEEALIIIESLSEKQKRFLNTFSEQNSHLEILRSAILREAVQGKLVPQDPNEWNAQDLLDQIQKEREQLINGKKSKKSEIKPIDPSEIPFEIPENWGWYRLEGVCTISTWKKDVNEWSADGIYPFFTCAQEPLKSNSYSFDDDCILLPGNWANLWVVMRYTWRFELYQRTYCLHQISDVFDVDYLEIFLQAYWKKNIGTQYGSGINYIRINNLTDFLVNIPPISEQKRIVIKINDLLKKLEELETIISESKNLSERLLKVGLKEVFNS